MDTVTMLRDLWRHRFALVGVLALSLLAGILVLYSFSPPFGLQSRKYTVGVANTRVLIDTPASQVAAISPEGSGDLGMRADLLSRIMVEGTVKAKIAELAGLHPNALFGGPSDLGNVTPPRNAPLLTTEVVVVNYSTQLPLIQIEARAADAGTAARIADAAVKGLRDYVDQQAADTNVPAGRRVRVTPLGETQVETATRGPKMVFAFVAMIFVFGLGCAAIVAVSAIARSWLRATAAELRQPDDDPDPRGRTRTDPATPEHAAPPAVSQLRQPEPVPTASGRPAPLRPADEARAQAPKGGRRAAAERRRRSAS